METKNSAIFELNLKGNVFPQKMKKLHEEKCRPIYSTWHRSFSWRTFGIIYCSFADFLVFNPPAAWKQNLIKTKMHCKINFTYESDCVSKNVTPRRMLKKSFLITQMNRQNNSFQGKIVLHLQPYDLFGFCLDCYTDTQNSLDRSKLRPSQTPTNHPSKFCWHINTSVRNIKL